MVLCCVPSCRQVLHLVCGIKSPAVCSAVNKCHPRLDIIITGSSRSLYAWKPVPDGEQPFQSGAVILSCSVPVTLCKSLVLRIQRH